MRRRISNWTVFGLAISLIGGFAILGCDSGGQMSITDLNPKVGHIAGDQPIRIVGDNFRQDIGYTVYFGTRKAGSVTILDPSTILVTTPSQTVSGSVDVTIRSDDGSAYRIPGGFRYEDMAGSVIGKYGEAREVKKEEKGNLAY
jgi:hypothetical protein